MPPLKITVATVTYNAGTLIDRTIRSVEEQDYPYVEHVIIDGNSQDETLELVHHYQERNSVNEIRHEIACLSEPDKGLYDAMNKALDMATGRYVIFINAGDTFHSPTTLSLVAKTAITEAGGERNVKKLPAVLYGDTHLVNDNGEFLRRRRLTPPERLTWHSFKNGMLVCHQAFFARTDIARRMHYDRRYRLSADYDWCIRIMREGERLGLPLTNLHIVVADYLSGGLSKKHHRASLWERLTIMVRHYGLSVAIAQHLWFIVRVFTKK